MNTPTLGLRVASVIFGLLGLGHLLRIIGGLRLQVGTILIGRRWSVVALIVAAALCIWLWTLASGAAKSENESPPIKPAA